VCVDESPRSSEMRVSFVRLKEGKEWDTTKEVLVVVSNLMKLVDSN